MNDRTKTIGFAASVLAAGVTATAAMAAPGGVSSPTAQRLVGTVGPGFTITLTSAGAPVKHLRAGGYEVVVRDRSPIHNFDLFGPGARRKTDVAKAGTVVWKVTLKPGLYRFQCDPHKQFMKGSFKVS